MNERIRELAEQCRIEEYSQHGDLIEFGFDEEKFAELIVRECIDSVSDCSVEYCTRPQIVSEIKEHFGVE